MKKNSKLVSTIIATILLITFFSANITAGKEQIEVKDTILDANGLTFGEESSWGDFVNCNTYIQDQLASYNGYQYAAYYNANRHVCVARRRLPDGEWEIAELTDYLFESDDAHNVVSLGLSPNDGTIHLAFDSHSSPLHYRKSIENVIAKPEEFAWNASLFGPVSLRLEEESGEKFNMFTYPRFITTPDGDMLMAFRERFSGSGQDILYKYSNGEWKRLGLYTSSQGVYNGTVTPNNDDRNAYHNRIMFDSKGRLHTTFCWREGLSTGFTSNHDLNYIYSDDQGLTWKNNDGEVIGITGAGEANSVKSETAVYVKNGIDADNNFYGRNAVSVRNGGKNRGTLSYFRFDLSKIHISNIQKVILRLYVHYRTPATGENDIVNHNIYGITNNWDEKTMTWKNGSPNHNPDPDSYEVTGIGSSAYLLDTVSVAFSKWVEFDVSNYVKDKMQAGEDKVSFMIAAQDANVVDVHYSERYGPLLVIKGDNTTDWQDLVNVESKDLVAVEVPQGNLLNDGAMYVDPRGIVHSVMVRGVFGGKYHHFWRDESGEWHHTELPFGGSRPKLVADDKAAYLIYTSADNKRLNIAKATRENNYEDWKVIYDARDLPSFGSDVQVDFNRFEEEHIVSIMVQEYFNDRKPGDPTPIHIIDWVIPDDDDGDGSNDNDNDDETLPDETLPDETIPDETLPDETGGEDGTEPDGTIPDETVPDETIPDETDGGDETAQETPPDGTDPEDKDSRDTTDNKPDAGDNKTPKTGDRISGSVLSLIISITIAAICILLKTKSDGKNSYN